MTDWRAPVVANIYEASGVPAIEERDGRTSAPLVAEVDEEQRERIMRGEVCFNCFARFPERPSAGSALRILTEPLCQPFGLEIMGDRGAARRAMVEGRCPHCGVSMSYGFAQGMETSQAFKDERMRTDVDEAERRDWDWEKNQPRKLKGVRKN